MPATSRTRPDRDRSERRGCTCFARPSTPSARWPSWPWPWAQASSPRNSQAIHERGPRAAGSPSPQRSRGLRCWQDRALGQGVRSRSRDTLVLLLSTGSVDRRRGRTDTAGIQSMQFTEPSRASTPFDPCQRTEPWKGCFCTKVFDLHGEGRSCGEASSLWRRSSPRCL